MSDTVYRALILIPERASQTPAAEYFQKNYQNHENTRTLTKTDDACLLLSQERWHAIATVFRWDWEANIISRLLHAIETLGVEFTKPAHERHYIPCPSLFLTALVGVLSPALSPPEPSFPASCKIRRFTVIDYTSPFWVEKMNSAWLQHSQEIEVQLGIGRIKTA